MIILRLRIQVKRKQVFLTRRWDSKNWPIIRVVPVTVSPHASAAHVGIPLTIGYFDDFPLNNGWGIDFSTGTFLNRHKNDSTTIVDGTLYQINREGVMQELYGERLISILTEQCKFIRE